MINTDCILWQTQLFVNTLAYFYLKAYLEAKPDILLNFMLINFLVWTLQFTETLILYLFCPKNYEKTRTRNWQKISILPQNKKVSDSFEFL